MMFANIKILLPVTACLFMVATGENLCSDFISDMLSTYQNNVTDLLQELDAKISRLENKTDNLIALINEKESTPVDCEDVRNQRQEATISSGLYLVQAPGLLKRRVYCNFTEQETWTTISRRIHEEDIFNRSWEEYKNGFGKASGDYWIGNEMIHWLTTKYQFYLRITMTGFRGKFISSYTSFRVEDELAQYRLVLGPYDNENSNGGDSFFPPNAKCNKNKDDSAPFATYDFGEARNCSKLLSGGWWFTDCGCSNLNGKYVLGGSVPTKGPNMGLYWDTLYYNQWDMKSSLRTVIMEIKRI